jgi:mannose-6-phosphate isomerase-like protein (cupin superfamily)
MRSYLSRAIQKLKPGSEYVIQADDYSTIKWVVLEGEAPTQAEIDDAIEQVKADEIAEIEAQANAKAAAQAKLAALGLTVEDLQALGL